MRLGPAIQAANDAAQPLARRLTRSLVADCGRHA
jgi:hypothetical protein